MTRSELIAILTEAYPHLQRRYLKVVVGSVFNEIGQALMNGDRVELRGFGSFSVRRRAPRKARNPKTGASVSLEERFVVYFRAGKGMHQRLNTR